MLSQKNHLTSELSQEEPTVVLLVEQKTALVNKLVDFFQNQQIPSKIFLVSDFKNDARALGIYAELKNTLIYKILFVGGDSVNYLESDFETQLVLEAINQGLAASGRILPIFFLLNYSTPLELLALELKDLSDFWQKQEEFLASLLKKFPLASFCLLEDFIGEGVFSPRFNLLFAGFRQNILVNCERDFYWQDFEGLMANFARLFFQSQGSAKYLLRGKKTSPEVFLAGAAQSCRQYFQKDFQIRQILVEEQEKSPFLADFVTLHGKGGLAERVLDEQIRQLPHSLAIKGGLNTQALSTSETTKPSLQSDDERLPLIAKPVTKTEAPVVQVKPVAEPPITSASISPALEKATEENATPTELVDKKLKAIFKNQHQERHSARFEKNLHEAKVIVKKNRHRKALFYVGLSIFSIGGLLMALFANFFLSQLYLKAQIFKQLEQSVVQEKTPARALKKGLVYQSFSWQLSKYMQILGGEQLSDAHQYWTLFNHLAEENELSGELQQGRLALLQAMLETEGDPSAAYDRYLTLETQLYEARRLLNQVLDAFNLDNFSADKAELLSNLRLQNLKKLKTQQRAMALFKPLAEILRGPARSTIVLLVQDNSELRSSGGFLSNLLLLSFENGRLMDWQIQAVEDLDQRIYGDRQANQEIQALLASERLFLRDANWPTDFTEAGKDMTWFIEQSLSIKPDLMMTINTRDLQQFLSQLGPLDFSGTSVNSANFFELANQDGRSLNDFLKVIFERFLQSDEADLDFFAQYLTAALENKESYAFSSDKSLQPILENNLWAGQILDTPCPSEFANVSDNCFVDGIYQLENNIGLNQSNRLVVEKIEHSVGISENFIRHKRKINLQNLSRQSSSAEGDYQGFFKFYLPLTARLEQISLMDASGKERIFSAKDYLLSEVGEKQLLSLRLNVPKTQTLTLEITYVLAHQLQSPFSYVFLEQKQPGLFNKSVQYQVLFAEDFKPQLIAPQATYENKVIKFDNNNSDNYIFGIAFSRAFEEK